MEDALLQIVQEYVAFKQEPTTDGYNLEIGDTTTVDGSRQSLERSQNRPRQDALRTRRLKEGTNTIRETRCAVAKGCP